MYNRIVYEMFNIRARWKSCIQAKRQEDAQLRRLQRDYERRLVKSASHLKCFPSMLISPPGYTLPMLL